MTSAGDCLIGMGATGHYWLALSSFFETQDFYTHVINLIQTDGWQKVTELHKRKNDIIDSVLIADLICYGSFQDTTLDNETMFSLRQLTCYRSYLVGVSGDFKRKIIAILDWIFPEYEMFFSKVGIFLKASKAVISEFSSSEEFNQVSVEILADTLSLASRNRMGMAKAEH